MGRGSRMLESEEKRVVRAYGYKLLSVLMAAPPTPEAMDLASSDETDEVLSYMVGTDGLIAYRLQVGLWRKIDEQDRDAWLGRQESVYNRLFIGPGHLVAPPWESVYASEDGLMFQEETLDVRNTYTKAGLTVPYRGKEADDHIAFELDYMYHEAVRSSGVEKNGADSGPRSSQRAFLERHLLTWVPQFVNRIGMTEGAEFYAAVGGVLVAFLNADAVLLRDWDAVRII